MIARKLIVETPLYEYDITLEHQNRDSEQRYYIRGPYMQYETKNKNKRKYIKEEMMADVSRFDTEMIQTGRAGGELNHCVPDNYSILTTDGWKELKDINDDEEIYTLNISNNNIEVEKISEKVHSDYSGTMIRISGRNINSIFTPNHRILVVKENWELGYVTAQSVLEGPESSQVMFLSGLDGDFDSSFVGFFDEDFELGFSNELVDTVAEEPFTGKIACVVAPKNGNWYCKDTSGKCFWTGNSSNPEIDLSKLCHKIITLEHDEPSKHYIGKSMVLSTPSGKILEALIKDNVRTGMSTKALGQIEESADCNLVKNFYLLGVDCVYDPSYSSAFVNGILESKEFIIGTDNKFEEVYDKFEKGLATYPSRYRDQINAHINESVKRFLASLK